MRSKARIVIEVEPVSRRTNVNEALVLQAEGMIGQEMVIGGHSRAEGILPIDEQRVSIAVSPTASTDGVDGDCLHDVAPTA